MAISLHDRERLRTLAAQVRQIADLPDMARRRRMWIDHNNLQSHRPMILCFPEGAWHELMPDDCRCQDKSLHPMEWTLLSRLYWWQRLRDDNFIEPCMDVSWVVNTGNYGVEIPYHHGDNRGSYAWDPPLKNFPADLDKLRFRQFSVDRDQTARNLESAHEILGDILSIRLSGRYFWTLGLTHTAVLLVGLEQLMMLMYDEPGSVHRLMAFLRDDAARCISWLEAENLLTPTNGPCYTGSGGVGATDQLPDMSAGAGFPACTKSTTPIKLRDIWGFAESQETVGISPEMFAEFIFPYQLPLLERFGLNCYGCCEPVHSRIEPILTIPRLRRVSVSPWADEQIMADKLRGRAVYSRKPNPTPVCAGFDEPTIRRDLARTLAVVGKQSLEIIMKDTHTIEHQPWRLEKWLDIAYEHIGVDRFEIAK